MKRIQLLLAVMLLSGCVTFGQMKAGLDVLMGQRTERAFDVLGYPSDKQEYGSDTVYTWYTNSTGTIFVPNVSTTYGSVGRVPVYAQTTSTQAVPVSYNCVIKLVANSGVLKRWEYNGNIGGCSAYIQRLKTLVASTEIAADPRETASAEKQPQPVVNFSNESRVGKTVRLKTEPAGLYREASSESERIQRLYKANYLDVEEVNGSWLKVRVDGTSTVGWVKSDFVAP